MQDATTLVVPLWAALAVGGGILASYSAMVAWVFSTFERKEEANCREDLVGERLTKLESQAKEQWAVINQVAVDVAYIRGRMEPKE